MHPGLEGQIDVILSAYKHANLSPDQTTYVECHGTGTPVGDRVEVEAVHRAMGASESRMSPVLIGSIKPNIGHSEAASSMGTIIKSIMALENGIIPPTAGLTRPHPASRSFPFVRNNREQCGLSIFVCKEEKT